jgi:hypothetical protein
MRRLVLILFAVVAALALSVGLASAAPPPLSEGGMTFPAITDASGPEEFSWTVDIDPEQELKSIDDQHAGVYWEDGHPAFTITANPAHDAEGSSVPTTLSVSEGDVITLTVHHRAGNPLRGGAPFVYPIVDGAGWPGGFRTIVVPFPLGDLPAPKLCLVPKLKHRTLKASKTLLEAGGCKIGAVKKLRDATVRTGKVIKQFPAPGTQLSDGAEVQIILAPPRG